MSATGSKITSGLFCAVIGGLALWNLATPPRDFSEQENRYLAQLPAFSLSALGDGSLTEDLEEYITDQFLFRDSWVGVKALTEKSVGKNASNGVYFAKDGYLMESFDSPDWEQYEKNLGHVAAFGERVERDLGVEVETMLVPTAALPLADKLPAFAPEADQLALLEQAREALPRLVDVSPALEAHNREYIYYKTDHHWTSLGAFYAWESWRGGKGLPPLPEEAFQEEVLTTGFYGTTYSKASLYSAQPDTIHALQAASLPSLRVWYNEGEEPADSLYQRDFLEVKDKYSVFLSGNQPITRIQTGLDRDGARLLIIKDSYANTFAQFPVMDYEEVVLVDLRYYRAPVYDYIRDHGVTDVLVLYSLKGFSSDTGIFLLNQ